MPWPELDNLPELGLEVKELRTKRGTIGLKFWTSNNFPRARDIQVGDLVKIRDLPAGKYLALGVGPVGEDTVLYYYFPCGTFCTPAPLPGHTDQ